MKLTCASCALRHDRARREASPVRPRLADVSQPALTCRSACSGVMACGSFDRKKNAARAPTRIGTSWRRTHERLVLEMEAVLVHTRGREAREPRDGRLRRRRRCARAVVPQAMMRFRESPSRDRRRRRDIIARRVIARPGGGGRFRNRSIDGRGGATDLCVTPRLADRMTAVVPAGFPLARRMQRSACAAVAYPIIMARPRPDRCAS